MRSKMKRAIIRFHPKTPKDPNKPESATFGPAEIESLLKLVETYMANLYNADPIVAIEIEDVQSVTGDG